MHIFENINFEIDNNDNVILNKQSSLQNAENIYDAGVSIKILSNEPIFVEETGKKESLVYDIHNDKRLIIAYQSENDHFYSSDDKNIKSPNRLLHIIKINSIDTNIHINLYQPIHTDRKYFNYYVTVCIIGKICEMVQNYNNSHDIKIIIDNLYLVNYTSLVKTMCINPKTIFKYKNLLPQHFYHISINNKELIEGLLNNNDFDNENTITLYNIFNIENNSFQMLSDQEISNTINYLEKNNINTFYCKGITSKQFKTFFRLNNLGNSENYLIQNEISKKILLNASTWCGKLVDYAIVHGKTKSDQDLRIGFESKIERHCSPKKLDSMSEIDVFKFEKQLICEFAILLCILHQPFNEQYFKNLINNRNPSAYITYRVNNKNATEYLWVILRTLKNKFTMPEQDVYDLAKNVYNYYLDSYIA